MSDGVDKPLRIAVAHLFTTGRNTKRDAIVHLACKWHEQGANPQEKDWIVNPERKITRRVYRHTGISTKESAGKPVWHEVRGEVRSFLDEVNVLFVFDSNAERWFRDVVYEGIAPPDIVDLLEAYKFFLPEKSPPYSDLAIVDIDSSIPQHSGARKLNRVLSGMSRMLEAVLEVILKPEKIPNGFRTPKSHYPVYNLLDWSLAIEGASPAFKALQRVAAQAARIRWEADQMEGASYRTPVKMDNEELLLFIEHWRPSNLIREDRKPYNEDFMAGEIPERYSRDKSTRSLIQVLEFILKSPGTEPQDAGRVKHNLDAIKSQCKELQEYIFSTLRQVYWIAEVKKSPSHSARYNEKYEDICSAYYELIDCLKNFESLFLRLELNELSQLPPIIVNDEHLDLVSKWSKASDRIGKLQRSLLRTRKKFPKPGKSLPDQAVLRMVKRVFKDMGTLNQEYFASDDSIQDGYLELGFNMLYSDKRFKERPEQRWYAEFISKAINFGNQYVAEARTGTGKTLGYLIPACEHSRINKSRQVIVATATINLMDQILTKEWRTLTSPRGSPYRGLKIATLKGKRNYLCVTPLKKLFSDLNSDKHDDSDQGDDSFYGDDRLAWLYLFQILTRKNGHWDSATEFYRRYSRIAKEYPVDAETTCKPKLCKMGKDCIYPQAVRRAQYANVVITNHHKLANLDDEIRKRASVCIIDESDQFPDNLRSALSESITREDVWDFLRRVAGTKKRRGFVQLLWEKLKEEVEQGKFKKKNADGLFRSLREIEQSCNQIFFRLRDVTFVGEDQYAKRWKDLGQRQQNMLQDMLDDLGRHLNMIEQEIKKILDSDRYRQTQDLSRNLSSEKDRLLQYRYEVIGLLDSMEAILPSIYNEDGQFIVTYQQSQFNWTLAKMPFNIGDQARDLVKGFETTIFTSATLYVDQVTDLFVLELFDDFTSESPFTAETRISTPFEYSKQVGGAVTSFIPCYKYGASNREWGRQVIETIALLSIALDGRTLVLFTGWEKMPWMYQHIRAMLKKYDIPVLLQDKTGSSETVIEEFDGLEESVLLGTGRFWTGVNFPGPTLSQLIIVRLPNAALGDPLVREREERWSQDKFWGFWYSQNTRRKLNQGFGRLIRKKEDRGLFVLLDRRILCHQHMKRHRSAIPVELNSQFKSPVELATWGIKRLGLSPELKEREINLEQVYQEIQDASESIQI